MSYWDKQYTDGFFNVSKEHGFLPIRDPLKSLPDQYKELQDLKFYKPDVFDAKSNLTIPIENEFFRSPRLLNEIDYEIYMNAYKGKTSGCSFAFIDFKNTKFYELNVLNKL